MRETSSALLASSLEHTSVALSTALDRLQEQWRLVSRDWDKLFTSWSRLASMLVEHSDEYVSGVVEYVTMVLEKLMHVLVTSRWIFQHLAHLGRLQSPSSHPRFEIPQQFRSVILGRHHAERLKDRFRSARRRLVPHRSPEGHQALDRLAAR